MFIINLRSNKISEELSANSKFLGWRSIFVEKVEKQIFSGLSDFGFNSRGILKDTLIIDKKFNKLPYSKDEIKSKQVFSNKYTFVK